MGILEILTPSDIDVKSVNRLKTWSGDVVTVVAAVSGGLPPGGTRHKHRTGHEVFRFTLVVHHLALERIWQRRYTTLYVSRL